MIIPVKTQSGGYDIILERGALSRAGELLDLSRRALIVTDDGVPAEYAETVASFCRDSRTVVLPQGEKSKTSASFLYVLKQAVEMELTRTDCVIAVGGGVVGDHAGFVAACYMRGIDFYNIPTTVLSQVDSSIGGKTAIDFAGYKNIVGAFWQPKRVIIDTDVLKTLPERQISNGLAEAVKMSLTSDPELFALFERGGCAEHMDEIIERSLKIKRAVVENDEREGGLRKILNFGHTLAHAIESVNNMQNFYHGECVAAGMVPMCAPKVRERLVPVLKSLNLPVSFSAEPEKIIEAVRHDKKCAGNRLTVIRVPEIGKYEMSDITTDELFEELRKAGAL